MAHVPKASQGNRSEGGQFSSTNVHVQALGEKKIHIIENQTCMHIRHDRFTIW